MKAYKAFNKDLTCRDFQYEMGKTYKMKEKPIVCGRGFHACTVLDDVFKYYKLGKNIRICEVDLLGDIDDMSQKDSKVATNKIKIIRELKVKDLLELGGEKSLVQATVHGSSLITDEMIQNLSELNRMRVAQIGSNRHRNCLVYDKSDNVRLMLARYGTHKNRDVLVYDKNSDVRVEVVKHGTRRHHDLLVEDESVYVRIKVARFGNDRHRTQLVNDVESIVRYSVASYGNINIRKQLMDDVDFDVRNAARHRSRFWVGV